MRSKKREEKRVRIISSLRQKVKYDRINLLDIISAREPAFHIIFCRNVLIYFDRQIQQKILSALCSNLVAGGYLFIGHSESITGFELPVKSIIPTVFQKL